MEFASSATREWRRKRDSNPRYSSGHSGLQDHRHRPLGHPSARAKDIRCAKGGDIRPGGDGWVGGQGRITLILSPPDPANVAYRPADRLVDPKLHHSEYGSDGLILQLHAWDVAHHHGNMGDPALPIGNGVLVWFEVDDFDAVVARARALRAPIVIDVHRNPPEGDGGPNHRELWVKDPDGYTVVIASPDGECQV